mmetsp:Transcript_18707/g.44995  ORF Transcript_18707/g.44995 Transcript_18707/m.44995 type:complete len:207 (-) Transcript_18707:371-991(-)
MASNSRSYLVTFFPLELPSTSRHFSTGLEGKFVSHRPKLHAFGCSSLYQRSRSRGSLPSAACLRRRGAARMDMRLAFRDPIFPTRSMGTTLSSPLSGQCWRMDFIASFDNPLISLRTGGSDVRDPIRSWNVAALPSTTMAGFGTSSLSSDASFHLKNLASVECVFSTSAFSGIQSISSQISIPSRYDGVTEMTATSMAVRMTSGRM